MTSITVCGHGQLGVAPDRASVDLGLAHVARTSSLALDVIGGRARQLADLLTELGFPRLDWVTQGVSVTEEWEWRRDTNTKVGYRATSGVIVRVGDLDKVAELLSRAVDEVPAYVRSLRWSVSADNPLRRVLLAAAATDAIYRADAYADALGLQRGAVEEVSDVPLTSNADPQQAADLFASRSKATETSVTTSVNPGEIELEASVYVRFATIPFADLPQNNR